MAKQTVKILADATFDLPLDWVTKLNVGILPTQIMMEDREKPYRNYIDITPEEFFASLLTCKEIPTTAVPTQGDIHKVYEDSLKEYDSLIVLAHSSKMSGSYNSALKATEMFPSKDITVVDTLTITVVEGLLVYEAATMALNGAAKEEILARLNDLIPHTHGVAILQNLDYLRKGGRISIAKHVIAQVANFRPILAVEEGLVQNIGTVRGFDKGLELLKKRMPDILKNRKLDAVFILHSLMPDEANELKNYILSLDANAPNVCEVFLLGPVLGTHIGPYALGIGWVGNWDHNWFK
jgi:DegV family protein with EDD domain